LADYLGQEGTMEPFVFALGLWMIGSAMRNVDS